MRVRYRLCYLLFCSMVLAACGKVFLDIKPNQSQKVPQNVEDYFGLLKNENMLRGSSHSLGWIGSDEVLINKSQYDIFPSGIEYDYQRNAYIWANEIYQGGEISTDWNLAHNRILCANLVLEGVLEDGDSANHLIAETRGTALFHRALNWYSLAQLYCPQYDPVTADFDQGLPLRTSSDVTLNPQRSSVSETYAAVIEDLELAAGLLPARHESIFLPGRAAVYSLLARIWIHMGDFKSAGTFASLALDIQSDLIDFNDLVPFGDYTFQAYGNGNCEIIFYNSMSNLLTFGSAYYYQVDTNLMSLYEKGDLRKEHYFELGGNRFIGSYTGNNTHFTGFTTAELYLILAECKARAGLNSEALSILNKLRKHRMDAELYQPLEAVEDVLGRVLEERRKELVFRGTRWEDLRRLNKEPGREQKLTRLIGDDRVELMPGSPKYVWPLPVEAISVGGYQQNQR